MSNTINSLFMQTLDDDELTQLVTELQKRGYIPINEGNVSYKLPK